MALLERNREPSPVELRLFGLLAVVFGGLVGGLVLSQTGSQTAAAVIWSLALALGLFYYAVPSARRFIIHGWTTAFYPVGWLFSHALLAGIYYLVITPVGLVMRLSGRDPLERVLDRSAASYWVRHRTDEDSDRYFQQF